MFDSAKHWTADLEQEVKRLCLLEEIGLKLFVWVNQDKVCYDQEVPRGITIDTAVIFKVTPEELISLDESKIIVRKIEKNHLKSLVGFMNSTFIPTIMNEKSWPDNVKKEFLAQLHKFMTSITEVCFQLEGYTELYIPKEDLSNTDGQDKDLIQRLETTIIQWNRQIKEIVSNPDSHQENENSGPLDEI
jgi:nucleoside diphosphate kinase